MSLIRLIFIFITAIYLISCEKETNNDDGNKPNDSIPNDTSSNPLNYPLAILKQPLWDNLNQLPFSNQQISQTIFSSCATDQSFFISTYQDIYKSSNGLDWNKIFSASGQGISSFLVLKDQSIIYYNASAGLYKSNNDGNSFSSLNSTGISFDVNSSVEMTELQDGKIFILIAASNPMQSKIYYSNDGASSFIEVKTPSIDYFSNLKSYQQNKILLNNKTNIYISEDFGENWTSIATAMSIGQVLVSNDGETILYTEAQVPRKLFKGSPGSFNEGNSFLTLLNFDSDKNLYAINNNSGKAILMRSNDLGESWLTMGTEIPANSLLSNQNHILAVSGSKNVYVLDKDKAQWKTTTEGLPPLIDIKNTIHATYALTANGLLFISYDKGKVWYVSSEKINNNCLSLAIAPWDQSIWIGAGYFNPVLYIFDRTGSKIITELTLAFSNMGITAIALNNNKCALGLTSSYKDDGLLLINKYRGGETWLAYEIMPQPNSPISWLNITGSESVPVFETGILSPSKSASFITGSGYLVNLTDWLITPFEQAVNQNLIHYSFSSALIIYVFEGNNIYIGGEKKKSNYTTIIPPVDKISKFSFDHSGNAWIIDGGKPFMSTPFALQ